MTTALRLPMALLGAPVECVIVVRVPQHVWVPDWRVGWVVPARAREVRA